MLVLTQGQTAEYLIVTLNEKRTLDNGYYLFVFTSNPEGYTAAKIYYFAEDESSYQDRYNKFPINTSTVFLNKPTGEYLYKVYEQASSSNVDPTGLTEVERGILVLNPATEFEFEKELYSAVVRILIRKRQHKN